MSDRPSESDRAIRIALYQYAADNPGPGLDKKVRGAARDFLCAQVSPYRLAAVLSELGITLLWMTKVLKGIVEGDSLPKDKMAAIRLLRELQLEAVASFPGEREYVRKALGGEALVEQEFDDPILKMCKDEQDNGGNEESA